MKIFDLGVVFLFLSIASRHSTVAELSLHFHENDIECDMGKAISVFASVTNEPIQNDFEITFKSENPSVATTILKLFPKDFNSTNHWNGEVKVNCHLLGMTRVFAEFVGSDGKPEKSRDNLNLIVIRNLTLIDQLFTAGVGLVITFLYINFGAALDFTILKEILKKPIGPIIGFVCQFLIMPILGFTLGYVLFPDMIHFRLGLFFTGVSPGGGLSNIFTVILNGNLNLSIAMTTISNIAALGMMPLWIFTLGAAIFKEFKFTVPYVNILGFSFGLVIPLSIGMLIQKFFPNFAKILIRTLKPVSITLITLVIAVGIFTNLYIFKLFSLRIILAGMALPWSGYLISWLMAKLLKQNKKDALTIAIEAGIQNIGIAIFLLRFSLPQPYQDLTTVIPLSCSFMTPLPLLTLLLVKKIYNKCNPKKMESVPAEDFNKKEIESNVLNEKEAEANMLI